MRQCASTIKIQLIILKIQQTPSSPANQKITSSCHDIVYNCPHGVKKTIAQYSCKQSSCILKLHGNDKNRDRFVETPFYTPRFIKPQGAHVSSVMDVLKISEKRITRKLENPED